MSDQETPEFKIVDRRQAVVGNENEAEADVTASTIHTPDAQTESGSVDPVDPEASSSQASDDAKMHGLPDPTMLLQLAALQMDTSTLIDALLVVFDGHAWRSMGFVADPQTGETKKDLQAAQLAIDCVQFLYGKAEVGMPETERREAQRRLNDLRMNYLSKLRES